MNEIYIVGADLYYRLRERVFCYYISERRAIYLRRQAGMPRPWSNDVIFEQNRFCNVYRHLDPSSIYLRQQILNADQPRRDIAFNALLFRLMLGPRIYDLIGWQRPEDIRADEIEERLRSYNASAGIFTANRPVGTHSRMGASDRFRSLTRLIALSAAGFDSFLARADEARTARELFGVCQSLPGFGPGLGYELSVDYLTDRGDGQSLFLSPKRLNAWTEINTEWVRRGIEAFSPEYDRKQQEAILRYWQVHYPEKLNEYGFSFLPDQNGEGREIALSLVDIHQCLHEFGRYIRYFTATPN